MAYTRVNWNDGPEGGTALSAKNLNTMDVAIAALDSTITNLQASVNTANGEASNARHLAETATEDVATLSRQLNSLVQDLGNNFITFLSVTTTGVAITPIMQHTVKIGPLFFVHFSFKLTTSTAGTEIIASLPTAARPLHTHTFACVSASPSASDMHAMVGRVNTDGSIWLEWNKSSTTSGAYVFDAEFFYCIDH